MEIDRRIERLAAEALVREVMKPEFEAGKKDAEKIAMRLLK